jgi:hypothetical protein
MYPEEQPLIKKTNLSPAKQKAETAIGLIRKMFDEMFKTRAIGSKHKIDAGWLISVMYAFLTMLQALYSLIALSGVLACADTDKQQEGGFDLGYKLFYGMYVLFMLVIVYLFVGQEQYRKLRNYVYYLTEGNLECHFTTDSKAWKNTCAVVNAVLCAASGWSIGTAFGGKGFPQNSPTLDCVSEGWQDLHSNSIIFGVLGTILALALVFPQILIFYARQEFPWPRMAALVYSIYKVVAVRCFAILLSFRGKPFSLPGFLNFVLPGLPILKGTYDAQSQKGVLREATKMDKTEKECLENIEAALKQQLEKKYAIKTKAIHANLKHIYTAQKVNEFYTKQNSEASATELILSIIKFMLATAGTAYLAYFSFEKIYASLARTIDVECDDITLSCLVWLSTIITAIGRGARYANTGFGNLLINQEQYSSKIQELEIAATALLGHSSVNMP